MIECPGAVAERGHPGRNRGASSPRESWRESRLAGGRIPRRAGRAAVAGRTPALRASLGTILTLIIAMAVHAQPAPAPPSVSVVVPVVGSVDGIGDVRWRTDVELTNDQPGEATVALILPTAPGQPVILTSIAPGDTLRFADVIGQAFGMDSAISPLIVQTLGRRSVAVRAVAYASHGTDSLKLEPIGVPYGDTYFPLRALSGLSFNDNYRTNIGLSNLSENEAVFFLALQRVAGRSLAITKITLPPISMVQAPIQLLFPLITSGDGFRIVVECAEPRSGVYASVIANATSEATFISPMIVTELEQ